MVGGCFFEEKIKSLKDRIKVWNKDQFGDTLRKYKRIEEDLNKMEEESDDRQLTDQQLLAKKKLQQDLWEAAQAHESLLRQKARSRWIKEGDCNSRYFQLMINASRRNNCLKEVMIDGSWIEDLTSVKEEVRRFFL